MSEKQINQVFIWFKAAQIPPSLRNRKVVTIILDVLSLVWETDKFSHFDKCRKYQVLKPGLHIHKNSDSVKSEGQEIHQGKFWQEKKLIICKQV